MIVWLASFPRSGNTLLRTILKQTMGRDSFSDDPLSANVGFTGYALDKFGHREIPDSWESFYRRATDSAEVFLVKTHRPPRDGQPAIYVVRDGRQAVASYSRYHRDFLGEQALSTMALILGADFYGSWSGHYNQWCVQGRHNLVVRYEELVHASSLLVHEIAEFIGHDRPVAQWINPFAGLHADNPAFFRIGDADHDDTEQWSAATTGVFFMLHGEVMMKLGYTDQPSVDAATACLSGELIDVVEVACSLRDTKSYFEEACRQRLSVIHVLDAEVRRLAAICGEKRGYH